MDSNDLENKDFERPDNVLPNHTHLDFQRPLCLSVLLRRQAHPELRVSLLFPVKSGLPRSTYFSIVCCPQWIYAQITTPLLKKVEFAVVFIAVEIYCTISDVIAVSYACSAEEALL
jgi:hypothetical protein